MVAAVNDVAELKRMLVANKKFYVGDMNIVIKVKVPE
jgi:hypothetical protein